MLDRQTTDEAVIAILKEAQQQIAAARKSVAELLTVTPLTCAECGRPWLDAAERWRSYLTIDDAAAFYCPDCSEVEFE